MNVWRNTYKKICLWQKLTKTEVWQRLVIFLFVACIFIKKIVVIRENAGKCLLRTTGFIKLILLRNWYSDFVFFSNDLFDSRIPW